MRACVANWLGSVVRSLEILALRGGQFCLCSRDGAMGKALPFCTSCSSCNLAYNINSGVYYCTIILPASPPGLIHGVAGGGLVRSGNGTVMGESRGTLEPPWGSEWE